MKQKTVKERPPVAGDIVEVIAGDFKGKFGMVMSVDRHEMVKLDFCRSSPVRLINLSIRSKPLFDDYTACVF